MSTSGKSQRMAGRLEGKVALVSGASQGIGKAIAECFISEGAEVFNFDIQKPKYAVKYFSVDIRDEKQIQKAMKRIPRLNIVVNNAGIYFAASVEKTTKDEFDRIVDINLKGTYFVCKYTLPFIKDSKGSMITISSGLGLVPEPASPAYCMTKAALIMLTKCMAQEYAAEGVRVNAILPGPIDTPLLRKAFTTKSELVSYTQKNPMRRIGTPEDVARVALFLASDEAKYVTGSLYAVDGGESSSSLYSK